MASAVCLALLSLWGSMKIENSGCRNYNKYGYNTCGNGSGKGLKFAVFDVMNIKFFIDNGALLKKEHPGGNGCSDIGHKNEYKVGGDPAHFKSVKTLERLIPWGGKTAYPLPIKRPGYIQG